MKVQCEQDLVYLPRPLAKLVLEHETSVRQVDRWQHDLDVTGTRRCVIARTPVGFEPDRGDASHRNLAARADTIGHLPWGSTKQAIAGSRRFAANAGSDALCATSARLRRTVVEFRPGCLGEQPLLTATSFPLRMICRTVTARVGWATVISSL